MAVKLKKGQKFCPGCQKPIAAVSRSHDKEDGGCGWVKEVFEFSDKTSEKLKEVCLDCQREGASTSDIITAVKELNRGAGRGRMAVDRLVEKGLDIDALIAHLQAKKAEADR
jgi:hypothetical protein